jgi:hypothetical protein
LVAALIAVPIGSMSHSVASGGGKQQSVTGSCGLHAVCFKHTWLLTAVPYQHDLLRNCEPLLFCI